MKSKEEILKILAEQKPYLAAQYHVGRIGLFGSTARGENTLESDVDILVEFNRPIGWEFIDLADYLETLFETKVDLVSKKGIRDRLWPFISEDLIYA